MPGLLWLVIGVCLAGAVQDMLVLAASVRRGGKSLAEIARAELGPWASAVVSVAILFIVIIALAGLGFVVVVKRGKVEEVKLPEGDGNQAAIRSRCRTTITSAHTGQTRRSFQAALEIPANLSGAAWSTAS